VQDKLERFLLLIAEQLTLKEIKKEPLKDTILVTKVTAKGGEENIVEFECRFVDLS